MSEWIKVRRDLRQSTEVLGMSAALSVSVAEVIGLCVMFWIYADGETDDGHLPRCTLSIVDRIVEYNGFGQALVGVGWLEEQPRGQGLFIPNFDRHMGKSAKRRHLASERQRRCRARKD